MEPQSRNDNNEIFRTFKGQNDLGILLDGLPQRQKVQKTDLFLREIQHRQRLLDHGDITGESKA